MKRLPYLWIGIFSLENLEIHGEISATIKKGGPNYLKSQKSPVVGQSRLLSTKGRTPSNGRNNAHWGRCRYIYIYIYVCVLILYVNDIYIIIYNSYALRGVYRWETIQKRTLTHPLGAEEHGRRRVQRRNVQKRAQSVTAWPWRSHGQFGCESILEI